MANMTVTTEAAHIGEVWVDDVIAAQEFSFEFTPRVFRKWRFVGHGDVYHIPRVGNLAANSKAASTAWTPEALTDTEQTVVINVHDTAGFQLEDIAALLSNTELRSTYQKKIGYALGRAVEVNLAALPQNFSQTVGTLGNELLFDNMLTAYQNLADGGTLLTDDCCWILSPAACVGLIKQDVIANVDYRSSGNAGRAIERATIGTILGAPVIQSNLTRAPSAGQSESALFKREAIALIMAQEPKIVTEYIAKELSWVVGGHQIYGYSEVDRYAETPSDVTASDDWAVLLNTIG
jgi:hypothetical protein